MNVPQISDRVAHEKSSSDFNQKPWFKQFVGSLFGFDFFIAYAWKDGRDYAVELAEQLEKKVDERQYNCFLDSNDYRKGDDWKEAGELALQNTSVLILVGSPGALHSEPVLSEVRFFTTRRSRIIPIEFVDDDGSGTFDSKHDSSAIHQYVRPEILRIKEPQRYRADAPNQLIGPSATVVKQITGSFDLMTQEDRRARFFGVAAIVFAVVAILSLVFWRSSESNFQEAIRQTSIAQANERNARQRAALLAFDRARYLSEQGRSPEAVAWMAKSIELAPGDSDLIEPARYNVAHFLDHTPTLQTVIATDHNPYTIAFHPDGRRLFTSGSEGTLHTWDAQTGKSIASVIKLDSNVERLAVSPDGKVVYCTGSNGVLHRVNSENQDLTVMDSWSGHQDDVLAVAVSPNGKYVATGGVDGLLLVRDASSGEVVSRLTPHGRPADPKGHKIRQGIRALAFGPDGRQVATAGWDGSIKISDCISSKVIDSLRVPNRSPFFWAVCYFEVGGEPCIAGGDFDGHVYVWRGSGRLLELARRSGQINALAAQPGRTSGELAIGSNDTAATIWLGRENDKTLELRHPQPVMSVAWNSTGQLLATGCPEGVRICAQHPSMQSNS